mgnify:CR=1 FL=1
MSRTISGSTGDSGLSVNFNEMPAMLAKAVRALEHLFQDEGSLA